MIKVSVIVTSYNAHNLERCLNSLLNQDYDKRFIDLEIIVVDSGSTDGSVEILNKYKDRIKIILKPKEFSSFRRLGPAQARNIGVQNSKGEILIFTDSDCIPSLDWVKEMVVSFQKYQVDCIIGNREPDVGEGLGTFVRRYDFILYSNKFEISKTLIINEKNIQKGTPFVPLSGNNFAIKREAWDKLGGMKTVFKHAAGEDIMLEIDLIKGGYNILFNPQSKVIHFHPISIIDVFKKVFPRSEAIYLLSKYSNGFINWKHFAERGHILNLRNFFSTIFFIVLILSIVRLLKVSFFIILSLLFMLMLLAIIHRIINLSKRLESILDSKGKEYKKVYKLSLFKLFYFDQIHFFLKTIALLNYLWCFVSRK
jgi:glycosyltransferase involved in cell wall biosynthesis